MCDFWELKASLPGEPVLCSTSSGTLTLAYLLFPLLTQRLQVPFWICTGMGGSWYWQWGAEGWNLCIPARGKSFTLSGCMSFGDIGLLWERLDTPQPFVS